MKRNENHPFRAALDEYNAYQRNYLQKNPEKRLKFRINSAVNLLRRQGWTCTPPADRKGE